MWSHNNNPAARSLSFKWSATKRDRSHRAGSPAPRRRALGLRPWLDALETRQLLSTSAVVGPTVPMETLNLQLKSATSATLAQLTPLFTAAGASVQATTISGLYEVSGPAANVAALAKQLSSSSVVQSAAPIQMLQIATVPNDPSFTNGSQWGLNGTWGINAPTAWDTHHGLKYRDRRRHRHRHELQPSRPDQ